MQTEFKFRSWGGRRKGAGRRPTGRVSHQARPEFRRITPVHVTMRVRSHVWNLRSGRSFRRIRRSLAAARGRFGFRVIEFSILGNHLHLVVEADDDVAVSRGVQGLAIRIARALDAMMGTAGKVFADHYHSRLLRSPTELVRVLAYVLGNAAHHFGLAGVDPFGSLALEAHERARLLPRPLGWLLREGISRARKVRPQPP